MENNTTPNWAKRINSRALQTQVLLIAKEQNLTTYRQDLREQDPNTAEGRSLILGYCENILKDLQAQRNNAMHRLGEQDEQFQKICRRINTVADGIQRLRHTLGLAG